MPDVPDSLIAAMRAAGVDVDAVLAQVDERDPIPPDEAAVAEQSGDWRSELPDEPEPDLSEAERAMVQPSLLEPPALVTGKYHGADATATEEISGAAVEVDRAGPLRPDSLAHRILAQYRNRERLTAYEASLRLTGDFHAKRRESTRLLERGYLRKDGTKKNEAPSGRPHVDAFVITPAGIEELGRLEA